MPGNRGPAGEEDGEDRGHVRRDAREHVVDHEEEDGQEDHDRRGAKPGEGRGGLLREPRHEADAVQAVREGDEGREPDEDVPRGLVREDVVPFDDAEDHHEGDRGERDGRRVDELAAEDPEREGPDREEGHHDLVPRDLPHPVELLAGPDRDLGAAASPRARRSSRRARGRGETRRTPTGRKPTSQADHEMSTFAVFFTISSARRFGARPVRKSDEVTQVVARAVHMSGPPRRRDVGPGSEP